MQHPGTPPPAKQSPKTPRRNSGQPVAASAPAPPTIALSAMFAATQSAMPSTKPSSAGKARKCWLTPTVSLTVPPSIATPVLLACFPVGAGNCPARSNRSSSMPTASFPLPPKLSWQRKCIPNSTNKANGLNLQSGAQSSASRHPAPAFHQVKINRHTREVERDAND